MYNVHVYIYTHTFYSGDCLFWCCPQWPGKLYLNRLPQRQSSNRVMIIKFMVGIYMEIQVSSSNDEYVILGTEFILVTEFINSLRNPSAGVPWKGWHVAENFDSHVCSHSEGNVSYWSKILSEDKVNKVATAFRLICCILISFRNIQVKFWCYHCLGCWFTS